MNKVTNYTLATIFSLSALSASAQKANTYLKPPTQCIDTVFIQGKHFVYNQGEKLEKVPLNVYGMNFLTDHSGKMTKSAKEAYSKAKYAIWFLLHHIDNINSLGRGSNKLVPNYEISFSPKSLKIYNKNLHKPDTTYFNNSKKGRDKARDWLAKVLVKN